MQSGQLSTPSTHLLLYDDHCPLCSFQMRLLTWLDWFNLLSMLPLSHERATLVGSGLRREDLLEAIHCVTRDGQVHRGARALRFIGLRMPALIPLALFLWIPGVIAVAEVAYKTVSRNRHTLSRMFGCKGACSVLPPRQRENDRDLQQLQLPMTLDSPVASSTDKLG